MRYLIIAIVILLTIPALSGLDGHKWVEYDEYGRDEAILTKISYLHGYLDACSMAHKMAISIESSQIFDSSTTVLIRALLDWTDVPRTKPQDIVKAVDQFYKDYANKNIAVVAALRYVRLRLIGTSADSLRIELEKMREKYQK